MSFISQRLADAISAALQEEEVILSLSGKHRDVADLLTEIWDIGVSPKQVDMRNIQSFILATYTAHHLLEKKQSGDENKSTF